MDQRGLARGEAAVLEQVGPDGEIGLRQRGGAYRVVARTARADIALPARRSIRHSRRHWSARRHDRRPPRRYGAPSANDFAGDLQAEQRTGAGRRRVGPLRCAMSGRFTPAACTRISTSSGFGAGTGPAPASAPPGRRRHRRRHRSYCRAGSWTRLLGNASQPLPRCGHRQAGATSGMLAGVVTHGPDPRIPRTIGRRWPGARPWPWRRGGEREVAIRERSGARPTRRNISAPRAR